MKKCPTCKKALRVDNTRGYCAECLDGGKDRPKVKTDAARVQREFRQLARSLGFDPVELDREWRAAWIAERKAAAHG